MCYHATLIQPMGDQRCHARLIAPLLLKELAKYFGWEIMLLSTCKLYSVISNIDNKVWKDVSGIVESSQCKIEKKNYVVHSNRSELFWKSDMQIFWNTNKNIVFYVYCMRSWDWNTILKNVWLYYANKDKTSLYFAGKKIKIKNIYFVLNYNCSQPKHNTNHIYGSFSLISFQKIFATTGFYTICYF